MPIEIKHRDTGAILRTVDADTLNGADLSEADLRWADLFGADLSRADLSEADLSRADLFWADLNGANLRGANLSGATIYADKLDRLLARAMRSDGYEFFLFALQDGSTKIKAGCRWMELAEYRDHLAASYPDTDKAKETLDILTFFEARAR